MGRVKQGDLINVTAKMEDQKEGLFLRAVLRDATGSIFATKTMTGVGNGVYQDRSEAMPATAFVTADIEAFNDIGFSDPYASFPAFERYDLDTTTSDLASQITASSNDSGRELTLEIEESELTLESDEEENTLDIEESENTLDALGSDTTLEGQEQDLTMDLEEKDLELNIDCED